MESTTFDAIDIFGFEVQPGKQEKQIKIKKNGMICFHMYDLLNQEDSGMGYEELMWFAFSDFVGCAGMGSMKYRDFVKHYAWSLSKRENADMWRRCRAAHGKLKKLLKHEPDEFINEFIRTAVKPLPLGMGYKAASTVGRTGIYAWGEHVRPNRGNARRTKNPPALAVGSVNGGEMSSTPLNTDDDWNKLKGEIADLMKDSEAKLTEPLPFEEDDLFDEPFGEDNTGTLNFDDDNYIDKDESWYK